MTLDNWVRLSPDERNELRRKWHCSGAEGMSAGDEMFELVQEAAARFKVEYGGHPKIYCVEGYNSAVGVTTALHDGELIEDLPSLYAAIPVAQTPVESNKTYYLQVWAGALSEFLGWSPPEIEQWASQHEQGLNGQHGWLFYHEPPCWYITPLLIPQDLRGARHARRLECEIQAAIGGYAWGSAGMKDYDWNSARARLAAVIERFRREEENAGTGHCCPAMSDACRTACDCPVRVRLTGVTSLNTRYQLMGRTEVDEGAMIFYCPWCGTRLSTVPFSVPIS